jgi:hypothetical protein
MTKDNYPWSFVKDIPNDSPSHGGYRKTFGASVTYRDKRNK